MVDARCKHLNDLSDRYHLLFGRLIDIYIQRLNKQFSPEEPLNAGDYALLLNVGEHLSGPISLAEAAKALSINPSTATRRANKLVKDGLISKANAPDDDRRYDLMITPTGSEVLSIMDRRLYEAVQKTYENVSEEDLNTVYRFMEECISQLDMLIVREKEEQ